MNIKITKLLNMINDKGTSENEKYVAKKLIENIKNKLKKETGEVLNLDSIKDFGIYSTIFKNNEIKLNVNGNILRYVILGYSDSDKFNEKSTEHDDFMYSLYTLLGIQDYTTKVIMRGHLYKDNNLLSKNLKLEFWGYQNTMICDDIGISWYSPIDIFEEDPVTESLIRQKAMEIWNNYWRPILINNNEIKLLK